MKDLYKRGWGVVRRQDDMDSERVVGARAVRGVALSKEFRFRMEEKGAEGTERDQGNGSDATVRYMAEFQENLLQSKWTRHFSVREPL